MQDPQAKACGPDTSAKPVRAVGFSPPAQSGRGKGSEKACLTPNPQSYNRQGVSQQIESIELSSQGRTGASPEPCGHRQMPGSIEP